MLRHLPFKRQLLLLLTGLLAIGVIVPLATFAKASGSSPGWVALANLPVPTEGACTGFNDGKIYVAYGDTRGGDVNTLWIYSTRTNTWSPGPAAPLPVRAEMYRGVVVEDQLYCMGGRSSVGVLPDVERFDPKTNTWSTLAPMPVPLAGMTAVAIGNNIYTFGGRTTTAPCGGGTTNTILRYNIPTNTWTVAGTLTINRSDATAAVIDGKAYIFGGCDGDTGAFFDSVEVFRPLTGTSTLLSVTMPGGPRADAAAATVNKIIHIVGGWNSSSFIGPDNHLLFRENNTFTVGLRMPRHCPSGVDRGELELVTNADPKIYAVAGSCPAFGASIANLDSLLV